MSAQPQLEPPPALQSEPVAVLYIGGFGRSGSTLTSRILAEIPELFTAGEVKFVWERGVLDNAFCGCGSRFHDCPFWSAVGDEAFGGWDRQHAEEMVALDSAVDRLWTLPLLLEPRLSGDFERRLAVYAHNLASVYRAIQRVSGCRVLVDSTKDPHFALLLRHVPGVTLRVLHLIRDSRGVAFSWSRRILEDASSPVRTYINPISVVSSSWRWLLYNALFHLLEYMGVPRLPMRYEELVTSPLDQLERVLDDIGRNGESGITPASPDLIDGQVVRLGAHHIVSGNPVRMSHGDVSLRLDQEWKTKMPTQERVIVSLLTSPLLLAYGYGPRRRAVPSEPRADVR